MGQKIYGIYCKGLRYCLKAFGQSTMSYCKMEYKCNLRKRAKMQKEMWVSYSLYYIVHA